MYARDGKGVYIYTGLSFFRRVTGRGAGRLPPVRQSAQPDAARKRSMSEDRAGSIPVCPPGSSSPRMVQIPEGWFLMGSDTGQDNERPVHRVWVDAFEFGRMPGNARRVRAVCRRDGTIASHPIGSDPHFSNPDQPVVAVSWFDAVAYCEWLSEITGRRYPAADRSGMGTRRSRRARAEAVSLGRRPAGIACELRDAMEDGPRAGRAGRAQRVTVFSISAPTCTNGARTGSARTITASHRNAIRQGPPTGSRRASRGGSWRHYTKVSRCAARSSIPPEFQYADYGFRVARDC